MDLDLFGWNPNFQKEFDHFSKQTRVPARIISEDKGSYFLISSLGESRGKISGSFRHSLKLRSDFPAVGDWVVAEIPDTNDTSIIHNILPRKNELSRKVVGDNTEKQVLFSNIDWTFIVSGLDNNFNLRRLERYLALVIEGGSKPVIILNKADLLKETNREYDIQNDIAPLVLEAPVHFVSVITGRGLNELTDYFSNNQTVAFLGSSGVGKSTLINHLLGEYIQKTNENRASDSKGRHTTTRRQLFALPSGGMVIDTPGMREMQLWADDTEMNQAFSDVESLSKSCKFSDCTHSKEPGCAVQSAILKGTLSPNRLNSFNKIQLELKSLAKRQEEVSWNTRSADRKPGKYQDNPLKNKRK